MSDPSDSKMTKRGPVADAIAALQRVLLVTSPVLRMDATGGLVRDAPPPERVTAMIEWLSAWTRPTDFHGLVTYDETSDDDVTLPHYVEVTIGWCDKEDRSGYAAAQGRGDRFAVAFETAAARARAILPDYLGDQPEKEESEAMRLKLNDARRSAVELNEMTRSAHDAALKAQAERDEAQEKAKAWERIARTLRDELHGLSGMCDDRGDGEEIRVAALASFSDFCKQNGVDP